MGANRHSQPGQGAGWSREWLVWRGVGAGGSCLCMHSQAIMGGCAHRSVHGARVG